MDVIRVYADPAGGPPPQQHQFAEWFYIEEGPFRSPDSTTTA
jgi:hypothetical protein